MSSFLAEIRELVAAGKGRVSEHGFRELKEPDYHKGPSVLVLQHDATDRPIHVVWGVSKANREEAVLITAYRPDPARWSDDFLRRLPK